MIEVERLRGERDAAVAFAVALYTCMATELDPDPGPPSDYAGTALEHDGAALVETAAAELVASLDLTPERPFVNVVVAGGIL